MARKILIENISGVTRVTTYDDRKPSEKRFYNYNDGAVIAFDEPNGIVIVDPNNGGTLRTPRLTFNLSELEDDFGATDFNTLSTAFADNGFFRSSQGGNGGITPGASIVWLKADGTTPADSYTEEILHDGKVRLGGELETETLSVNSLGEADEFRSRLYYMDDLDTPTSPTQVLGIQTADGKFVVLDGAPTQVFRKADRLTPADSYTEEIWHKHDIASDRAGVATVGTRDTDYENATVGVSTIGTGIGHFTTEFKRSAYMSMYSDTGNAWNGNPIPNIIGGIQQDATSPALAFAAHTTAFTKFTDVGRVLMRFVNGYVDNESLFELTEGDAIFNKYGVTRTETSASTALLGVDDTGKLVRQNMVDLQQKVTTFIRLIPSNQITLTESGNNAPVVDLLDLIFNGAPLVTVQEFLNIPQHLTGLVEDFAGNIFTGFFDEPNRKLIFPNIDPTGYSIRLVIEGNFTQGENRKRFEVAYSLALSNGGIGTYVTHEPANGRANRDNPTNLGFLQTSTAMLSQGVKPFYHISDVFQLTALTILIQ